MCASVLDDGESKPAPGTLRLVQAFVNTRDLYHDVEYLTGPDPLTVWMRGAGLLEQSASGSDEDLEMTMELRESLRALLVSNNGGETDPHAIQDLNRLAGSLPLEVRFEDSEQAQVARPASTIRRALGVLLGLVLQAQASGTWGRLKACANPGCRWVFYDASKNRVGSWCRMSACGNRAKSRAHRERIKASDTRSSEASST